MGHNPHIGIRTFTGEVDFNAETSLAGRFRLSIKTNSLGVLDDISDKDRREIEMMMNEQVLESSRYPDIVYEAPTVTITRLGGALYSATLNGTLSFHGVTRDQIVSARIASFDEMVRASGEFLVEPIGLWHQANFRRGRRTESERRIEVSLRNGRTQTGMNRERPCCDIRSWEGSHTCA